MNSVLKIMYKIMPRIYVQVLYYFNTKKRINLNKPRTYNEKIQWIKLYGLNDLEKKCSDKYTMRQYVEEKGFDKYLTKVYGVYTNVNDINFELLPSTCVLKNSSGWNNNYIWNKDNSMGNIEHIKKMLLKWQKKKFGYWTAETQYFDLLPIIICEEYLGGEELIDYKFLCFKGEVILIQVDFSRYSEHKRNFYNTIWELQNITYGYPIMDKEFDKPDNFEEMLAIARELSRDFIHVRIDMYNINGRILIGEMTFTPTAGYKEFFPSWINEYLGEQICI